MFLAIILLFAGNVTIDFSSIIQSLFCTSGKRNFYGDVTEQTFRKDDPPNKFFGNLIEFWALGTT